MYTKQQKSSFIAMGCSLPFFSKGNVDFELQKPFVILTLITVKWLFANGTSNTLKANFVQKIWTRTFIHTLWFYDGCDVFFLLTKTQKNQKGYYESEKCF